MTWRLAVAAGALGVFAWWALHEGGAAPTAWYPGALAFLAALVAAVWAGAGGGAARAARWAIAALAGFTLWSYLSLTWAGAPGDAWDGANRTLLYLTVFALFALLPWRPREAALFLAGFAIVTALVGLGSVLAGGPGALDGGRLAAPTGYENASAGLFMTAFWAAVALAAVPGQRAVVRGVLLATAGTLFELVILCQSRGSLLAAGAALVLALAVVRERARLLLVLVAVGAAALPTLPFVLDVYAGSTSDEALTRAGIAMVLSAAGLLAAGLLAPRVPVRLEPGRGVALVLVAALAVAGLGAAVAGAAGTRFAGGAGSGRYDFWRVAWSQFAAHPIQGAGADNFADDYARERRGREDPLYPHSIEWRTLGQTGLVGAALLAAFLVAVGASARRSMAEPAVVAALLAAVAWLAHASIDWLWELPALGAPAMACLGIVAARPGAPRTAALARRGVAVGVTAVAVVAAASYALPALAALEIERAVPTWGADPGAARQRFERARELNPLSDRADVIEGTLALRDGDAAGADRAFRRARDRDAGNWYAQTQLAAVDLRQARRAAALAGLRRARRMNPNEPAITAALVAARNGQPLSPVLDAELSELAVPGPRARHSIDCRPVLGIGARCEEAAA